MTRIQKLMELTGCAFNISLNPHKLDYQTIKQYSEHNPDIEEIENCIWKEILRRDTLVEITLYSDTPIGHCDILHYDIDLAIEEAISTFTQKQNIKG